MDSSHTHALSAARALIKPATPGASAGRASHRQRRARAGFSIIEVVFGMFILAGVAMSTTGALLQSRRMAESNLAQAYAEVTAQSVIEQLVAQPYSVLSAPADVSPGITIKLPTLNAANRTTMDDFELPWAESETDFTDLGTADDPGLGVLLDAAYIRESNTIRPERYLRMRLCLTREISDLSTERRVLLTLRYQWAIPDRRGTAGAPIYLSGEFRTARSSASSF